MPLPDAEPKPNKANIYEQFSHIEVQDFTRDNLDVVRKPLNLNSESEDVLRRIELVGKVSNQLSFSGPLPGTSKIVTATATQSSANVTFFTPGAGEVWSIQGFAQNKGANFTAAITGYLIVDDGNQTTSIDMAIRRINSSSADPQEDVDFGTPVMVDENMTVKYRAYSTGFGDDIEGQIYCIRVR